MSNCSGVMKNNNNNISPRNKIDRKVIEKNRRIHMKSLCFKLASLIPHHHFNPSKEMSSQQDQFDQAATYINLLKEKVEELKIKKVVLEKNKSCGNYEKYVNNDKTKLGYSNLPVFKLRDLGSSLELVFVSGTKKNFMLHEVIRVLQDEGAEVVNVSISTVCDLVFHTLHAKVKVCRVGVEISSISRRLQELIC